MSLLFWRKKQPVRQKRKPKKWEIPKEHIIEILGLYDDMMCAAREALITRGAHVRQLPRYLFWKKVIEVIPDVGNYSVNVERDGNRHCITIVETVADDDYEPERPTMAQSSAEVEAVLKELEDKLNQGRPKISD
jgi:hypothetical protein